MIISDKFIDNVKKINEFKFKLIKYHTTSSFKLIKFISKMKTKR